MSIQVYILKLKSGGFYVGQSTDPRRRFFEHIAGKGANICKRDKPVELVQTFSLQTADVKLSRALESWMSLYMMFKLGSSAVTGGEYCDEMYRRASDLWLDIEMQRLREWTNRLAAIRGYEPYPAVIANFINWADGFAQKLK